jgi:hypothetical protein
MDKPLSLNEELIVKEVLEKNVKITNTISVKINRHYIVSSEIKYSLYSHKEDFYVKKIHTEELKQMIQGDNNINYNKMTKDQINDFMKFKKEEKEKEEYKKYEYEEQIPYKQTYSIKTENIKIMYKIPKQTEDKKYEQDINLTIGDKEMNVMDIFKKGIFYGYYFHENERIHIFFNFLSKKRKYDAESDASNFTFKYDPQDSKIFYFFEK